MCAVVNRNCWSDSIIFIASIQNQWLYSFTPGLLSDEEIIKPSCIDESLLGDCTSS